MSTAGFDHLRETARFSNSASPGLGPTDRDELLADSGTSGMASGAQAEVPEVVQRQRAVTSLKGGNLFVRAIAVPDDPVAPDGTVRVVVTVSNGALEIIEFLDDDHCTVDDPDPIMGPSGYRTQLRVAPDWTARDSRDFCIGMAAVGTKDETFEFVFPAPEDVGVHQIAVSLFLPNTATGSNVATRSIRVAEDGETDPEPDGAEDDEDEADEGDDGLLEQATSLVGAVSVALALFVILVGLTAVT